jgi:hypothetical protein
MLIEGFFDPLQELEEQFAEDEINNTLTTTNASQVQEELERRQATRQWTALAVSLSKTLQTIQLGKTPYEEYWGR